MYRLIFHTDAENDLTKHIKSGNKILLNKIYVLLEQLKVHPNTGVGKPERLKHKDEATWSRRIDDKHRLMYIIKEDIMEVHIVSLWGHYNE
jgi:toxin YoeB